MPRTVSPIVELYESSLWKAVEHDDSVPDAYINEDTQLLCCLSHIPVDTSQMTHTAWSPFR